MDDQGPVVEFVGTADSGLASGTGAMIFRSPGEIGAVYYEGDFSQGLPNGVVRWSKSRAVNPGSESSGPARTRVRQTPTNCDPFSSSRHADGVYVRISSLIIAGIEYLLVTAALLSACAGTARGSKSSVFKNFKEVEVIDYSLSKADALVVIRYPAIIHADAEQPYFHAFSINAIGGEVPPANRTKKVTTRIAQSVIAKSNYYVMSLYRELQKELPENTRSCCRPISFCGTRTVASTAAPSWPPSRFRVS